MQERLALDQRADLGLVFGALDEVALPVIGHQPLADLNGSLIDAGGPCNEAAAVRASSESTCARSSPRGMAYKAV